MKKKHLRSLNSVEAWLKKQELLSEDAANSFLVLKNAINSAVETEENSDVLPAPAEIESEPMTIALYSDGGCRGNPGPGAYAYVIQDHAGSILTEGVEFESH